MKTEKSNGWRLFGWAVVLVILYTVIFGAVWMISRSRKEKTGMQELDIQVELNSPAYIPIKTTTQEQIDAALSLSKSVITVDQRNKFIDVLQVPGSILVTESLSKRILPYQIIIEKKYYYFPKNGKITFLYVDRYYFAKRDKWRKAHVVDLAPNYIRYVNLELEAEK